MTSFEVTWLGAIWRYVYRGYVIGSGALQDRCSLFSGAGRCISQVRAAVAALTTSRRRAQ